MFLVTILQYNILGNNFSNGKTLSKISKCTPCLYFFALYTYQFPTIFRHQSLKSESRQFFEQYFSVHLGTKFHPEFR